MRAIPMGEILNRTKVSCSGSFLRISAATGSVLRRREQLPLQIYKFFQYNARTLQMKCRACQMYSFGPATIVHQSIIQKKIDTIPYLQPTCEASAAPRVPHPYTPNHSFSRPPHPPRRRETSSRPAKTPNHGGRAPRPPSSASRKDTSSRAPPRLRRPPPSPRPLYLSLSPWQTRAAGSEFSGAYSMPKPPQTTLQREPPLLDEANKHPFSAVMQSEAATMQLKNPTAEDSERVPCFSGLLTGEKRERGELMGKMEYFYEFLLDQREKSEKLQGRTSKNICITHETTILHKSLDQWEKIFNLGFVYLDPPLLGCTLEAQLVRGAKPVLMVHLLGSSPQFRKIRKMSGDERKERDLDLTSPEIDGIRMQETEEGFGRESFTRASVSTMRAKVKHLDSILRLSLALCLFISVLFSWGFAVEEEAYEEVEEEAQKDEAEIQNSRAFVDSSRPDGTGN
ncbi:ubiquitin-associated (UBA) protein [Striga asiatica]|uniref:Ubiquitin-associated (UBA) protein n=1 Tax=Striga asiatica TaxID=4170 RepID=A0A5A7PYJ6_STRAF|nr:ubiquitin-associated (UBA) protein [Striga asiatica]